MAEVDDALRRQAAETPGMEPAAAVRPARVDPVAVPGVFPLVALTGALDLRLMSAIGIGSFLLLTLVLRLSTRGGAVALMVLFSVFSYANHRDYLLERLARVRPRLALAAEVGRLGPFSAVSHDAALREAGLVPVMQFLLPGAVFLRFDSRRGELPGTEAVFGNGDWPQAAALGARLVSSSGRGGAFWLLPGEAQSRLPKVSYLGQTLGAEPRPELAETGFYRTESFAGVPGRWTNGAASLTVPVDPKNPPRAIEIEAMAPGRESTRLDIVVNGVRWEQEIPPERWSRKLVLGDRVTLGDRLVIELLSDTFVPAGDPSRERRQLGIVVTEIRLEG